MAKKAKTTKIETEKPTQATKAADTENTVMKKIDPEMLEAFKQQLLQLAPEERKAILKDVVPRGRRSREEPEIPENITIDEARANYEAEVAEARRLNREAQAARRKARWALKVWMAKDSSVVLKRGRVVYYDGMPEGTEFESAED